MSRTEENSNVLAGALIVGLTVVFVCSGLCVKHAARIEVESSEAVPTCYIVYTDEEGEPYAVPTTLSDGFRNSIAVPIEATTYHRVYYPLTMDEREWLAEILAGKAADRTEACQRMVATVMFNDITACDGDLTQAVKEYGLTDSGVPTAQIYGVIDAIFYCGEYMLDDDVLWFNDVDHPSAFHDSLVFVCECDGIAFYKDHRPAIVPGGAAE